MQYIEPGSTSQSLVMYLQDAVTGGAYVTEDQADWTFTYIREGVAAAVVDATITAGTLGTWADGTSKPLGTTGEWQIDFANAAFAAGVKYVKLLVTHDNGDFIAKSVVIDLEIRQADVVEISGDATAADNFETMLDGTGGQTLSLGKLKIDANDADGAVDIDNSGGAGINILASTNGVDITGTSGNGIDIDGGTNGIYIEGSTAAIFAEASAGIGLDINATGAGIDVHSSGGIGVDISGDNSGLVITSTGGIGVDIKGDTTAVAIDGTTGVYIDSSGNGIEIDATQAGIEIVAGTIGVDINATTAGITIDAAGDAVAMTSTGNNGDGLKATGHGTGAGIAAIGGSTGHGIEALGGGTSGDGIHAAAQTAGDGMELVGVGGGYDLNADIQGGLSGAVGSVTGDVGGDVIGNVLGDVRGDVVGNVDGSVASVTANVSADTILIDGVGPAFDRIEAACDAAVNYEGLVTAIEALEDDVDDLRTQSDAHR